MSTNKRFYILTLDGGGLKGLIAIKILQIIEGITGKKITESFDLIGGTSTGGLIAAAMTVSTPQGQPVNDLAYIEGMYMEAVQSLLQDGAASGKETAKLNDLVSRTVGTAKIADTYRPIFVPTYDLNSKRIVVFKTRSAILNEAKNVRLSDVCLATSAIPQVFPSHPIRYDHARLNCVDAGGHIRNPAIAALAELWKHKSYYSGTEVKEEEVVLLSISTGNFSGVKKDWTTDINDILATQQVATGYISEQKLDIDLSGIRFMRIDLNFGGGGYSFKTLMEVGDKIEALSKDQAFAKEIAGLLK